MKMTLTYRNWTQKDGIKFLRYENFTQAYDNLAQTWFDP